ncbi:hypothetical protein C9J41_05970 [Photobacterium sp. GB-50]|uniref:hypothetical protein n=1 Tax=Photobacterium sp. GB-50 TaxID=2022107 RepID=UPI000D16CBF9|nr:hypothetical protein [Photobacterium sp. GB-50]PSW74417.1 hypothetical protein C9J41_05970 [Photobacterium sp. GB-50]
MYKIAFILVILLVSGCTTLPVAPLSKENLNNIKSVAIVDFLEMRTHALVGEFMLSMDQQHFTDKQSMYFDLGKEVEPIITQEKKTNATFLPNQTVIENNSSVIVIENNNSNAIDSGITAVAASLTAGIINEIGKKTNERASNFNEIYSSTNPKINLRRDFLNELSSSLKEKGIDVSLLKDQVHSVPYLRWSALDSQGKLFRQRYPNELESVDADLVIQVSPVAIYNAGSALNAYARIVSVNVAIYNGRTKEFYGVKSFYSVEDNVTGYHTYNGLVENLGEAGKKLHESLLAVVPQISMLINSSNSQLD